MLRRLIGSNWKKLWIILVFALVTTGTAAQDVEAKLAQRADFVRAAGSVRDQLVQSGMMKDASDDSNVRLCQYVSHCAVRKRDFPRHSMSHIDVLTNWL